ncbi:hypothetical protein ID007_004305 [Salmonella enterica]|nr:hypothetical protein [Salmonella enterica]
MSEEDLSKLSDAELINRLNRANLEAMTRAAERRAAPWGWREWLPPVALAVFLMVLGAIGGVLLVKVLIGLKP